MPSINEEFLISKEGFKGCNENDLVKVIEIKNDWVTDSIIYKFYNVTQNKEVNYWIPALEFETLKNFRHTEDWITPEAMIELLTKGEAKETEAAKTTESDSLAKPASKEGTPPDSKKEYHKFWVPKKFVTKEKSKKTGTFFYIVDYVANVLEEGKTKAVHYHVFLSYNQLKPTSDGKGYDGWIEKNVPMQADKHIRTKEVNSNSFVEKFPKNKMRGD